MNFSRRLFIGSFAAATTAAAAEKIYDGGLADVSEPGVPVRRSPDGSPAPVLPAGARGQSSFAAKCVGCQLCVSACPNGVLHKGTIRTAFRPYMGFERGWCRTDCNACGKACPAGAIAPIALETKTSYHVGVAVWNEKACLAAQEGVNCHACERHCPVHAIHLVNHLPVVDAEVCIGCGACENHCPARPLPAMVVCGLKKHRVTLPADGTDALAEAKRMIEKGEAGCVLIRDGVIIAHDKGRGVSPILSLYEYKRALMNGATVVDKVVGRAAAAIAIAGGAKRVYALTASEEGLALLASKGIACSAEARVPEILDRTRTGRCPLESSVNGESSIDEMVVKLKRKQAELQQHAK